MRKRAYDAIIDLQAQLDAAKDKFLRDAGWTYTSTTPGSYWLWFKKFEVYASHAPLWKVKSVMISANTEQAIRHELGYIKPRRG